MGMRSIGGDDRFELEGVEVVEFGDCGESFAIKTGRVEFSPFGVDEAIAIEVGPLPVGAGDDQISIVVDQFVQFSIVDLFVKNPAFLERFTK